MIGPICLVGGWLGIAWALDRSGFFHAPQGSELQGWDRALSAVCWPYIIAIMLLVIAAVGLYAGISWIKGAVKW